jgi:hypothetical protein
MARRDRKEEEEEEGQEAVHSLHNFLFDHSGRVLRSRSSWSVFFVRFGWNRLRSLLSHHLFNELGQSVWLINDNC